MTLDELISTTGEWLHGTGPMSDVVISSRIRLARNLADYPFLATAGPSERGAIYRTISEEVMHSNVGADALLVDVDQAPPMDRQLLVERHLISRHQAAGEGSRGVSVSPSETRAIMINEEDHLRIQVLRGGLQLESLWREASEIDDTLAERLPFAFDKQLGYLTACPTNVGTGIRVSVMVHLPALKWTREIERVERAARELRLAVRGLFGEGTDYVGDLYQISNQTTLGHSEEEIIESFAGTIIPRIVDYEYAARKALVSTSAYQLDDRIWRAYGLLANARCISGEETQALLSPLRMGIHLGRFDLLNVQNLNELFLHTQSAHLQRIIGRPLDGEERAVARAEYLRKHLTRN